MMSRVKKGLVAGFVATLAVSLMEAVNLTTVQWFAPFPGIVARLLGLDSVAAGWVVHAIAGTLILGPLFGILCPRLPTDTPESKGIVFATGAFVAMMLVMMLFGDAFVFGSNFATVGWMLVTHVVFGIGLGNVYARLVAREKRAHAVIGGAPAH